jgi:rhamnosyltransferase
LPTPRASILIPTRNAGPRFAATLDAIKQQRTEHSFELVVVDSGSQDGTVELARSAADVVQSIPSEEFGHGRTRNVLAGLARGEWLVFLTQDAVPADEVWLSRLLEGLQDPLVAACFGRQLPRPGASLLQVHHLSWWYPPGRAQWSLETSSDARINRLFYSHVNSACKREVWNAVPFDETLVMSEDQDWSRRVLLGGWQIVYEPEAVVVHSHDHGLRQAFRRNFDSGASLEMITADTERDWFHLGVGYLASELRYLWSQKAVTMLPYAVVFEVARYAGFRLGRQHRRLPLSLKMRLGEHRAVWASSPKAQDALRR